MIAIWTSDPAGCDLDEHHNQSHHLMSLRTYVYCFMTMEHVGSSTSESGVTDDEFYGSHLEVVNMGACFHFLLNQKMY